MVNIFGKERELVVVQVPAVLLVLLCVVTAVVAGGIWGAIPGILKARFGSHRRLDQYDHAEFHRRRIGQLLLHSITSRSRAIQYLMQTAEISRPHIPRISQYIPGMPDFVPLSVAFLLAILMCVLVYIFLWKTKWGYELRAVSKSIGSRMHICPKKQVIIAMTISGGLAGMVAIGEVLGYRYRYYDGFSDGWGFLGIAVALLGRNHPLGIFFAADLFCRSETRRDLCRY